MELKCIYCLGLPENAQPDNKDRGTIVDGRLVCIDHLHKHIDQMRVYKNI